MEIYTYCLYFLCLFVSIVTCYSINYYIRRNHINAPGPMLIPFIGSYLAMRKRAHKDPYDMMLEYTEKYGDVWVTAIPLKPWIYVVSGEKDIEHILKDNFSNYVKGPRMHMIMEPLLGNGIFNVDGDMWKNHRRLTSHMFSKNNLISMLPIFAKHVETLMGRLTGVVDIEKEFSMFTISTICEIAFGVDISNMDGIDDFPSAFDKAQTSIDARFGDIRWEIYKTMEERELSKSMCIVREFIDHVIDVRLNSSKEDIERRKDLLSKYIIFGRVYGDVCKSDKYKEHLRDVVINIMVAGRDTTAQLLTWFFYLISKSEYHTRTLIDEVTLTYNGEYPTYDMLTKQTQYMERCIDETLRLYPPVPWEIKSAVSDDVLPSGVRVLAGSVINYSPWIQGRKSSLWENPLIFDPDRHSSRSTKSGTKFIPFNYGYRTCLGREMAYLEAKFVIYVLLSRGYRFSKVGEDAKYRRKITLSCKNGMYMSVLP